MEIEKPERLSMSAIKERDGWTETAIRQFLGKPDATATNPMYKSAAPVKLYDIERVETVERSERFAQFVVESARRRESAQAAADKRRTAVLAYVEGLQIELPALEQGELTARACRHYDSLQWGGESRATPESNPEFLERISVNYLRHALTRYDGEIQKLFGATGKQSAIAALQVKVYSAIQGAYPYLAEECERQAEIRGIEIENP